MANSHAGGNGSGRTTGRPAWDEILVRVLLPPRVDHRTVIRGLVGGAHGELVHVQLAEHDRAVGPQVGRNGGFISGFEAVQNVAAGLGVYALGAKGP